MKAARFVVVNNAGNIRKLIVDSLEMAGHEVLAAVATTEDAFNAVTSNQFDILIVDLVLPKHSGLEMVRKLNVDFNFELPIIMTTPIKVESFLLEALGNGVKDIIVAPFTKEDILKSVERVWIN